MNILLVEDDDMLAQAVSSGLKQNQWSVDCASDAAAARLALLDHHYAAVLLDLRLPDASGLTVLSALRARYDATPVLILTARDQLSDRVRGLDAGADDYLVKPFELDELYARLRALMRRSQGLVSKTLSIGDIVVDPARRQVTRARKAVGLSSHEYLTLLALMERQRRVVSRDQLERLVYSHTDCVASNTIAVYVHQLRRKLGEDLIETVHGFGYRIGAPQP
ncbi:response regulator transcription factor [Rhizobacter sp. Root16D2]|jgi:two-component system OmpR family response regulator|uniref:response regulator n=1 Tax=Rhizobacter sp. Root16D2 TaxID=1736479 RepID=UPI0006FCD8C7|nr:response regulator transcription factor [Rhizobacter sp. Root16D2]KRB12499.1 two-component system response regulator [Rhizobacter sp. Root16D2]